jgi:tetratricopeptide (TPR) repeat protein
MMLLARKACELRLVLFQLPARYTGAMSIMMRSFGKPVRLSLAFLSVALTARSVSAQYKVGDDVVVIRSAEITVDGKVLETLGRGMVLRVEAVEGDRLWVSNRAAGWIDPQQVKTPRFAVDEFSEQIAENPNDRGAYGSRGLARMSLGEIDRAIEDFDAELRLDPEDASAFGNRARCWSQKAEFDKAISDYSESIRLDPADAAPSFAGRGTVWVYKNDYDKAIADLTKALDLLPQFDYALNWRGVALASKGDFEKAIADFDEAVRINPKSAQHRFYRGWCRLKKGDVGQAVDDFEKALRLDPKNVYALSGRGQAREQLGEYDRAVADFSEALCLSPESGEALNALAWLRATCPRDELRDGKQAVELATKACESTGWKNWSMLDTLAAACAEAGNFEAAVKWQGKALESVDDKEKPGFQARLAIYEAGMPYRESEKK